MSKLKNIKKYMDLIKKGIKDAFIENKFLVILSSLLFIIPMFIGYLFPSYFTEILNPVVDSFKSKIEKGEITLTNDSIFFNNVSVAIMVYGVGIVFGLFTAVILITNGLFIGYYAAQIPLNLFLLYTIPHGIFEIPALIIAGASGFVLFKFIASFVYNIVSPKINENIDKTLDDFNNVTIYERLVSSLNFNVNILIQSLCLFGISVILFIIAALIEANLTIPIANLFI